MNNEELKAALQTGTPVILNIPQQGEIKCECVTGIIYRQKNGRIFLQAEVKDRNNNTVYVCDPKKLTVKKGKKKNGNNEHI